GSVASTCRRARSSSARWTGPGSKTWKQRSWNETPGPADRHGVAIRVAGPTRLERTMFPLLFADAADKADKAAKTANQMQLDWTTLALIGLGLLGIIVFLVVLLVCFNFLQLWIQAYLAGARIGFMDMIRMKLLKLEYVTIVRLNIALVKAGLKVTPQEMEAHVLSRGRLDKVVRAVIAAHKADMELPWRVAAAIDLAGRDVEEAVRRSVDPKVIDCPDPTKGRATLDGVCKNGIQLRARARVTVRTKLDRLVGGATEETIIAR